MLQHARGEDIWKLHILKVSLREEFVNDASNEQNTTAWCGSRIKALEINLDQKGVTVDITAVPIESGEYLTRPRTRKELRVIKTHCNAEIFEVKDATYGQLVLMQNALRIYRATEKPWLKWMDNVNNQLDSLAESKSHEQQAAYGFADGPLLLSPSGSSRTCSGNGGYDQADGSRGISTKNGVLADVPTVTKDAVNQALTRRVSDDAFLAEINKGTGQTTCTESERPKEMGEIQGARTCETMECSSNYFADNTAIPADDSSEVTQIKESIKILTQTLKIQAEATDIKLENLAAKLNAHGCVAIEGLVNEVNRLRARVAQVECTVAMQKDSLAKNAVEINQMKAQFEAQLERNAVGINQMKELF
ncbi:Hypothetical protein PENO1_111610 [Penicillium occitanis (nom. inval.)]|nr:Hypothetical protein PENO1_111610 [Penicillium occitanis (nom. inval.)]PCG88236.1 hypothetical protein PENOC_111900 [Penicillium occitanis (nom. inval.)]